MKNIIIENLSETQLNERQILHWPIWEKEISRFDWEYDSDEECFIINGEVLMETDEGNVLIKTGDFVTFKKGLKCVWNIKTAIKKHYNFK